MAPKRGPPKLVRQLTPPHILQKYAQMLAQTKPPHPQSSVPKYCEEAVGARLITEGFSENDLAASMTVLRPNCKCPSCHCHMKQAEPSTSANTTVNTTTRAGTSSQETRTPLRKTFVVTESRKKIPLKIE